MTKQCIHFCAIIYTNVSNAFVNVVKKLVFLFIYSLLSLFIYLLFIYCFNNNLLGDTAGLAAVPGKEEDYKQCLELSIKYAEALRCKR